MHLRHLALVLALPTMLSVSLACDSEKPKSDPAADAKAAEKAESEARMAKRKQEREAAAAEETKQAAANAAKILEITTIPEGTKIPKKIADACEQLVVAQSTFMKKFYPQVEDAALVTQLGMLRKQCLETNDVELALCQKFAIDATDEALKSMINEYLPACMTKYGAPPPA